MDQNGIKKERFLIQMPDSVKIRHASMIFKGRWLVPLVMA